MGLNFRSTRGLLTAGTFVGALLAGALFARMLVGSRPAPVDALPPALVEVGELAFPVPAADPASVQDTFLDARAGGLRTHHAVDIAAPRESVVVAVADGSVERLTNGPLGGISLYERDAQGRYCFYYAHLARYADGLADGQPLKRGQTVGYVGTSGNAPANAPHLHFAVHEAGASCHGRPVDPLPLLRGAKKAPVG